MWSARFVPSIWAGCQASTTSDDLSGGAGQGLLDIATIDVPYGKARPLLTRANTSTGATLQDDPVAYLFDGETASGS
jgi:hypothetical protein